MVPLIEENLVVVVDPEYNISKMEVILKHILNSNNRMIIIHHNKDIEVEVVFEVGIVAIIEVVIVVMIEILHSISRNNSHKTQILILQYRQIRYNVQLMYHIKIDEMVVVVVVVVIVVIDSNHRIVILGMVNHLLFQNQKKVMNNQQLPTMLMHHKFDLEVINILFYL